MKWRELVMAVVAVGVFGTAAAVYISKKQTPPAPEPGSAEAEDSEEQVKEIQKAQMKAQAEAARIARLNAPPPKVEPPPAPVVQPDPTDLMGSGKEVLAASMPAGKDLTGTFLLLADSATHDQALKTLQSMGVMDVFPMWDYLADASHPAELRREVSAAMEEIYRVGREARAAEDARDLSAWRDATGINAYKVFSKGTASDPRVINALEKWHAGPAEAFEALQSAVDGGSRDPLVRYDYVGHALAANKMAGGEALQKFREIAKDFEASSYGAGRKMFAHLAFVGRANLPDCPPEITRQDKSGELNQAIALFPEFLKENPGRALTRDAVQKIYRASITVDTYSVDQRRSPDFFKTFQVMATALPDSALLAAIESDNDIWWAWDARGGGWASTVDEKDWKTFGERLDKAKAAAERGWHLDPLNADCASAMITICMGKGMDRNIMERWFSRATCADPHNLQTCMRKMLFLEPKWGGSEAEVLEFGRFCAKNGDGKDRLATVLLAAHNELKMSESNAEAYMTRPHVWKDYQAVYDNLLADKGRLQTDRAVYLADRSQYIKAACDCGHWKDAARLMDEYGNDVDLKAFGGQALYDYSKKKAAAEAAK